MEFKRILVFRTGHLGDTLVAVPAFRALRETFPASHIAFLSSADPENPTYVSARDVLPEEGLFDDWISYPNVSPGPGGMASLVGLALKIRRHRYDAVFYLMTRYRTARQIDRDRLFFRLAGIRNIIGSEFIKRHNLPFDIPKPIPRIEKEAEFLLRLLREKGIVKSHRQFRPDLGLTPDEHRTAVRFIDSHGMLGFEGRRVAVGPGSKWDSKIWEEQRYADVVRRLIESHDVMPVIFGGPEDREKGQRLIHSWGRGANAAGELNVRNAAAALSLCSLYLGNDTGTMHLAASVGTTCVAMFSAVDWAGRFEPFGDQHLLFRRSVECEGCHSPDCQNVVHPKKCLDLIPADDVYQACVEVIARTATTV